MLMARQLRGHESCRRVWRRQVTEPASLHSMKPRFREMKLPAQRDSGANSSAALQMPPPPLLSPLPPGAFVQRSSSPGVVPGRARAATATQVQPCRVACAEALFRGMHPLRLARCSDVKQLHRCAACLPQRPPPGGRRLLVLQVPRAGAASGAAHGVSPG